MLVAGGIGVISSSEIYDPDSNTWSTGAEMGESRYRFIAVHISSDRILVAGGISSNRASASSEIFTP